MSSKRVALIVAGGSGNRMGSNVPKQFLILNGEPILMRTIRVFEKILPKPEIHLVLPYSQISAWKNLCIQYNFNIEHEIIKGGETRFDSVKNGLASIESEGLVAIHDGVRPLVSIDVIEDCYNAAEKYGCAIPVINPIESVRLIDSINSYPVDREKVYLVQTPQTFITSVIKRCYQTQWQSSFTDDASVAEFSGEKIHFVEGDRENIKITTPLDLKIAKVLLNQRNK